MVKIAVVAAVLVALLALAEASAYTVITTVEEENQDGRGQQSQQCMQQIQQQWQQLEHCQQYLSQGSPYAMAMNQQEQQRQHFQQCCKALQNFNDRPCRCEALSQVVRQQWGGGSSRGEGQQSQRMQEMMMKARYLPRMCNLGHECDIRAAFF